MPASHMAAIVRRAVTGEEGDGRIGVAMGEGNSGIGRAGDAGGDPRHDTEGDAGPPPGPAPLRRRDRRRKDRRPSAGARDCPAAPDPPAGSRYPPAGRSARRRACPRRSARPRAAPFLKCLIDQRVIENEIGVRDGMKPQRRDQSRIARSRAGQPAQPAANSGNPSRAAISAKFLSMADYTKAGGGNMVFRGAGHVAGCGNHDRKGAKQCRQGVPLDMGKRHG